MQGMNEARGERFANTEAEDGINRDNWLGNLA